MSMFARIPRGKKAAEAQNQRGSRIRIDRNFVRSFEQASVDQGLATIMLNTNSSINLTVGNAGGKTITLQGKDGNVVADQADISKILSVDSFINSERKEVQKQATSASLEASLAAIVTMSREPAMGPRINKLPNGYLEVYRGVNAQISVLADNVKSIQALEVNDEDNEFVKNWILTQSTRIRKAAGDFIRYRASTDDEEPKKLNQFLKEAKVLNWIYARLTSQKFNVNQPGFDLKSLVFPKDPSKGMTISFYELMNKDIRNHQGGMLRGMTLAYSFLSDESFLKHYLNLAPEVDLKNFDDDVTKTLLNVPIMVVPPFVNSGEMIDALAKGGAKGFSWNVGSSVTPQDNLRFIGTVFKRLRYVALNRAHTKNALFASIFPGFVYDGTQRQRDIYGQLKEYSKDRKDYIDAWIADSSHRTEPSATTRKLISNVLFDILQISSADSRAVAHIRRCLKLEISSTSPSPVSTGSYTAIPFGTVGNIEDTWSQIVARRDGLIGNRDANKAILREVMDKLPGGKDKEKAAVKKNKIGTVRSGLSASAKSTILVLEERRYKALSISLDSWFRSFLNLEVQAAVSNLIAAKLDWYLSQPIEMTRDDRAIFIDPKEFDEVLAPKEEEKNPSDDEDGDEDDADAAS